MIVKFFKILGVTLNVAVVGFILLLWILWPDIEAKFNELSVAQSTNSDNQEQIEVQRKLETRPKDAAAWLERGDAKFIRGDEQGAVADYSEAIKLNPAGDLLARIYLARGDVQSFIDDNYDGAIADFNTVINLKPADEEILMTAYIYRGEAKIYLGDYAGAIADYNEVINLNPKDKFLLASAYNGRGIARGKIGDMKGRWADFDEELRILGSN